MRLYAGATKQFIQDSVLNQISSKLQNAFFAHFRYNPSPAEVNSWRNSLRALSQTIDYAGLRDHGIILEYQLPQTSRRLDCLICGRDSNKKDSAIIIELKQWDRCKPCDTDNEVLAFIGGSEREVLHPSVQVGRYKMYLEDTHTAFYEGNDIVQLTACAYLHNYSYDPTDPIFDSKFDSHLVEYPLFTADDADRLCDYLVPRLEVGQGLDVLRRIEQSNYRPSKKLMDHVARMIKGRSEYILLDEQQVVFDRVLKTATKGFHDGRKTAIIIKGGPGTGKSVIAINLMAELYQREYNAHYTTGSKAFTETLWKKLGPRAQVSLTYFRDYAAAEMNAVDVLIADEAHRIRHYSDNRFKPQSAKSGLPQVVELVNAAKCSVFFVDDYQGIRDKEIGTADFIKQHAIANKCNVFEYELEAQFRCAGSDAFVNWINNTLGIRRTANVLWDPSEQFDFRIYQSPQALDDAIREKAAQDFTSRLVAGFCWKWSQQPDPNGNLVNDVQIGEFKRPWNAHPKARGLARNIPKASLWASDAGGAEQIGCIYTAQGFEFDYVGVIFGQDLVYEFNSQQWVGHREHSADPVVGKSKNNFVDLVKNAYRVLLSRGMKGCYVYFMDKDTERFVRSRMEGLAQ